MATKIGMTHYGIHVVTFEEVLPGGNDLGANVVYGADVFSGAVVGAEGSGTGNGVNRPASEVAVEKPTRCAKMTYAKGNNMQEKDDRRRQLVVEMNRLFLEWARLFREENGSPEKGSPEAQTLATIRDSKSIKRVYAESVRPRMKEVAGYGALLEDFFNEFKQSTCRTFIKKQTEKKLVNWESPPKLT